jgi:cytochrome P450
MRPTIWIQWAIMHGIPRTVLSIQARRNEPLARFLIGPQRGGDPLTLVEQIRARGPVSRTPFLSVTTSHALCRAILRDNRFKVTIPANTGLPRPITWLIRRTDPQLPNPAEPPSMLQVDPPEHSRYRHPVAHAFTPRAIDKLRIRIVEKTKELLDRLATTPHPDLVADFAGPLPAEIIAEVLGVPETLRSQMLKRGEQGAPLLDVGVSWKTFRRAMESLTEADKEFGDHIDQLRNEPGDDIFSHIIRDGNLTRRELATTAVLLAGAGFETTVNLIGNAIVLLLKHPDQLAMLRDNAELWPGAVEEVLRFDSPVQMTSRTAGCDLELGGHHFAAHEIVLLPLGGANRDPATFSEPNRFDITRANARDHLAFSSGVHACLGASLARMEATIALQALFERFPDLQLTGTPMPRGLANLHGYHHIPVRIAPTAVGHGSAR